jgi:hypothetical protein
VLVAKLTAVFSARSGRTVPKCFGLNGGTDWSRCRPYEDQNAGEVERHQREGMFGPGLLLRGIDAGEAVDPAFEPGERTGDAAGLIAARPRATCWVRLAACVISDPVAAFSSIAAAMPSTKPRLRWLTLPRLGQLARDTAARPG